ncbi:MAG: hypothetical protein ACR2F9_01875 [Longimicrobiaceae bacterium]
MGPYRWSGDLSTDAYHAVDEPIGFSNPPRPGRMERLQVVDVLARVHAATEQFGGIRR